MNVSQQNTDKLNAVISIEVTKADYQESVNKALRTYGQKANIPGFRKGKVPFGIINKMFGKSVLVEEINKLVSDKLFGYIRENQLNILGEPMPVENQEIDFDKQEDFTFNFDIALAPEIKVSLNKDVHVPYYNITVDDDMVNKQIDAFANRYGKQVVVEEVGEKDLVKGSMVELNEDGTSKEGGIVVESTVVSPYYFKNEDEKAKFVGAKTGAKVVFNPANTCDANPAELASMLNIDKAVAADVKSSFEMTIKEITGLKPAEMDQEFFDNVFGKDTVKSEDEFKAKVREFIAMQLAPESNYKFGIDAREVIEKQIGEFDLPDTFLKRWLLATNKERKAETIDDEYTKMLPDLKWHLIKEQIAKDTQLKIEDADLMIMAKNVAASQFAQYGMTGLPDDVLEKYAKEMLDNWETKSNLIDRVTETKILAGIKDAVTLDEKSISSEDFYKMFENK